MVYDYQTSYQAYTEVKENIDKCRAKVLNAIKELGICTDKDIANKLGWEINRVTGRRGELVIEGKVISDGKRKDVKTNRPVNYWRLTHVLNQNLEQKELFN